MQISFASLIYCIPPTESHVISVLPTWLYLVALTHLVVSHVALSARSQTCFCKSSAKSSTRNYCSLSYSNLSPSRCVLWSVHNRYTLINSRVSQSAFAATVNGTQKGKICMTKKKSFFEITGNNGTLHYNGRQYHENCFELPFASSLLV